MDDEMFVLKARQMGATNAFLKLSPKGQHNYIRTPSITVGQPSTGEHPLAERTGIPSKDKHRQYTQLGESHVPMQSCVNQTEKPSNFDRFKVACVEHWLQKEGMVWKDSANYVKREWM